tara:strand:+ start:998 stop:1819 length:822 start_codon:yes stop_codon:yes gene_type:complete
MNILITGATGYIGKHLISEIIKLNCKIFILSRKKNIFLKKKKNLIFYKGSLEKPPKKIFKEKFDILLHLAWDNLDDYQSKKHFKTLNIHKKFINKMMRCELKKIIVTGTCAEYGLKDGKLYEKYNVNPVSNYAIAKNDLRTYIKKIIHNKKIILNWIRVFHLFGGKEPKKTIIGQIKYAIRNKKKLFKMSSGEQSKDYTSIYILIKLITSLIIKDFNYEVINCCSGKPIKIIKLVKKYTNYKKIKIIRNYYPVRNNEPFKSYGSNYIINKILN